MKETSPFTTATRKIKLLRTNLPIHGEELCAENNKI